jgi:hypothetical protein
MRDEMFFSLFVKNIKLYMRKRAEIWQAYRRTTQTKGKNSKPAKFSPRCPKWDIACSSVCLSEEANPVEIQI